ncbi:MAG: type II 3-dehydroquinate dehydratase [Pseudomonadota bacterium]|nr:type II 3-dehydroquinate dehydratase [Pseudomonadota bacterium]
MTKPIFVLNGPNLNLLGQREPDIYGSGTLDALRLALGRHAAKRDVTIEFRQSNLEGVLVDWLQEAMHSASAVIINAAGYSHSSVAIRDAVAALAIPVVEVHLSNIHAREPFRHHSLVAEAAAGSISGFGAHGYLLALDAVLELVSA